MPRREPIGTFIIVLDAPESGKFMGTHWEWSGFVPYANCNGCGKQGHTDLFDPDPERGTDSVRAILEASGWFFFWMKRTDTPHCWEKATCPDCTKRLGPALEQYRTVGSESSNLNEVTR